jgi:hypothetical protein
MAKEFVEPSENDNIDCHLQQVGMGSLICKAAKQTGDNTTNEVNPSICFNCEVGKIYREVGCDAALPKIWIWGNSFNIANLFCKIRRRNTKLDYCQKCGLPVAETTRKIVSITRNLFETYGFYSAYKDIEKAREAIRDGNFENAVTRSLSCLESTIKTCHDELGKPLPNKKQITDLWKSARNILEFDKMDNTGATENLLNSLSGAVMHLGGLRNVLSDSHGKGKYPPEVSENIAELAINISSTLSTMILRRYIQIKEVKNEHN